MKGKLNPSLKEGDRIVLIDMTDEPQLSFGDRGTFIGTHRGGGFNQYSVKWDKGGSLFMLDDDKWMKEEDFDEMIEKKKKKNIQEADMNDVTMQTQLLKHFNMLFLKQFLKKLQETSVVNMFGASPYLYMGKERIAHQHKYDDTNEAFDELLDMANRAQGEMVNGVISVLEDEGKEITVEKINSSLKRYAPKVLKFYIDYY